MSMIFFCQSNEDLSRYGLNKIKNAGLMYPKRIAAKLNFSNNSWTSSSFCTLWDECWDLTRSYNENLPFKGTSLYYFLNDILDICDKAAFFYCEPIDDKSKWSFFDDKQSLFNSLEINFKKERYNDVFFITYVFNK